MLWSVFAIVVVVMLALDLGVFHKRAHEVSTKEALAWTALWVAIGLGFCAVVWRFDDPHRAAEYLACYLTEYALSVDNIFVFLVIFTYFAVPAENRHRVLFWGIFGAMVMRGLFLFGGVALVQRFHWTAWVLGGILVLTGIKLLFQGDAEIQPARNPLLRLARRLLPVTEGYEGQRFFVRRSARLFATPLFLALLVLESTDVLFAVDSVPAALALSKDPLVLYTSNILAILGLRSLFFAVAGMLKYLHYLKLGLSAILVFVGIKMLLPEEHKMPIETALSVVGGILLVAVVASIVRSRIGKPPR